MKASLKLLDLLWGKKAGEQGETNFTGDWVCFGGKLQAFLCAKNSQVSKYDICMRAIIVRYEAFIFRCERRLRDRLSFHDYARIYLQNYQISFHYEIAAFSS